MSEIAEVETTELVTLPARESALQVYSTAGGLDPLIDQIREKVAGQVYDMSTAKGRDECRSDAAKVARSKMAIEKLGKALSAEYKEIPKKIDAERRRAFEALEALQAQVRQPLTEWEQAEESRIALHKADIEGLSYQAEMLDGMNSQELRTRLNLVNSTKIDESWEEFEAEAHRVKAKTIETLTAALTAREKYEADQAELAELRRKQAEQEQKDRDERIAREAAERAQREAEARAQAEREAAARREAQAKAAAEQAEREKAEAIERQKQAEARAEAERLAAEQRAKAAAEAARQAEIQRQADEAARIEAEQKAREADRAHKAKTNNAAVAALVAGGLTAEAAKLAITLIAQGKVPAVRINY